jgi:hypothetical protein
MILAVTSWPEAGVAIAGILFVTVVLSVTIWQAFATGRMGISSKGEKAYRRLAEDAADAQRRTAAGLERAVEELTDLRQRTTELERMLKDVG